MNSNEGFDTKYTETNPMPPVIKLNACVFFFPINLTQKGKEKANKKVTKFKIAEVLLASSSPFVYVSLLVIGSPLKIWAATPVL